MNDAGRQAKKDLDFSKLEETLGKAAADLSYTQSIVDTVREPLLVLDSRLRVRSANRAFYSRFRVSRQQTEGVLIYDLGNRQWDIATLRKLLEHILPNKAVMTDFLVEHEFPTIGRKAMLLHARKLRLDPEELILLGIEDITDRRYFEIERDRFISELEGRNEALSQFAQIASHDLRTPLAAIAGFVHILQMRYGGKLDPDFDLFLTKILENTKSMAQLMTDLLQYAEAGEAQDATPPTANAEEVLDAVLRNLQAVIDESKTVVTHDPLPVVSVNPTELTQLLQNLIVNAIHYRAEASPRIHVSARQNGDDSSLFSVADNGVGVAAEHRKAIFEPFKRFHAKEQPGSGLGLAIIQRIIKRHGGKIWVESGPGQGSVFYFTIPCAASAFRPIEQNC